MATKYLFIEVLDKGFTLKENNKKRAIEDRAKVDATLQSVILSMTEKLNNANVHNMGITITVEENVPTTR